MKRLNIDRATISENKGHLNQKCCWYYDGD